MTMRRALSQHAVCLVILLTQVHLKPNKLPLPHTQGFPLPNIDIHAIRTDRNRLAGTRASGDGRGRVFNSELLLADAPSSSLRNSRRPSRNRLRPHPRRSPEDGPRRRLGEHREDPQERLRGPAEQPPAGPASSGGAQAAPPRADGADGHGRGARAAAAAPRRRAVRAAAGGADRRDRRGRGAVARRGCGAAGWGCRLPAGRAPAAHHTLRLPRI